MELEFKEQEHWYDDIAKQLDEFCKLMEEEIDKEQQQMKACEKNTEIETKLAQEMKLHNDLTEQLAELNRRGTELDRVCATFENCLTIADSDKNRLESAKEMYQIAKELTGIRFDYSAPPHIAKGYIKSEQRKVLQPFEVDTTTADPEVLWSLLHSTFACQENIPHN